MDAKPRELYLLFRAYEVSLERGKGSLLTLCVSLSLSVCLSACLLFYIYIVVCIRDVEIKGFAEVSRFEKPTLRNIPDSGGADPVALFANVNDVMY